MRYSSQSSQDSKSDADEDVHLLPDKESSDDEQGALPDAPNKADTDDRRQKTNDNKQKANPNGNKRAGTVESDLDSLDLMLADKGGFITYLK